jgi:hypothetical protein
MTNEEYIISQLSFYNELHHHLPKIQSKWFTDKSLGKIVKAMRIVYESGETVNPFTIGKYLERAEKYWPRNYRPHVRDCHQSKIKSSNYNTISF